MRPSLVKIAAWGEQYINKLFTDLVPILSAPNNLPALAKISPTLVIVYTDKPDIQPFTNIQGLQVHIQPVEPDDNIRHSRQILALTDELSIKIAAEGDADWFDFQA